MSDVKLSPGMLLSPIPDFRPDLGPCWIWFGAENDQGYGVIKHAGSKHQTRVHRLSYELLKGPIPKGLTIDHLCRVRRCVNPDHLEAVTSAENKQRGYSPFAVHARKVTCSRGHLSWIKVEFGRQCRLCQLLLRRIKDKRRLRCEEYYTC